MNSKLYQQLFNKLDSLGAIRKDLTFGCKIGEDYTYIGSDHYDYISHSGYLEQDISDKDKIIGHPPVLSDCIRGILTSDHTDGRYYKDNTFELQSDWDLSKPLLSHQSDELGEYLLTLLR